MQKDNDTGSRETYNVAYSENTRLDATTYHTKKSLLRVIWLDNEVDFPYHNTT